MNLDFELLAVVFDPDIWWGQILLILLYFFLAYGLHRASGRIAGRIIRLNRFRPQKRQLREERSRTLRQLVSSLITFLAFATAVFSSLNLFVAADTLIWMVGLFSAAFGLGARPLISDYLTGVGFLFEDSMDVGEKVEILSVEGIVEAINLRTISLRSPNGELFIIPNGEIRIIRNFSRGLFSPANVTIKLSAVDLNQTLSILETIAEDAMLKLPNLIEPWLIINESGVLGQQTELTIVAKARFGKAAEMKPRLLAYIQEHLVNQNIELIS